MSKSATPVFKIIPTTQKYDWGKIGLSSKVAQCAQSIPGFQVDENAPYAELWMGTHPTSPSHLFSDPSQSLASHLEAHPELIGDAVITRFADTGASKGNLPFLFKVLSIGKALSIQTHPDKETAKKLHEARPDVYKDSNHKPEMALALTPFTALCGFRPLPNIARYMSSTPELVALIPTSIAHKFLSIAQSPTSSEAEEKAALKDLFAAIMTAEEHTFKEQLFKLVQRYNGGGPLENEQDVKDLVLKLDSQFPGDIGVFCAFLLNYVQLKPGEAIFLAAGEPHAYVSGDIIECMATSDNVIRAGLTPKLRDVPNLVSGLTYTAGESSRHLVQPSRFSSSSHTTLYDPPIPEFSVLDVVLKSGENETHKPIDGPSLAIVVKGTGAVKWDGGGFDVKEGNVFFVGSGTQVTFGTESELAVVRAFVDVK
ncbi:mannose-6-phosphate isomerase [Abortiporus biennis]|nr:mannose-6-phosphate isomerase [Abortiporus biennis]